MESFKIAYKILFNLQFEVTGYAFDLNQQVTIVPDADTKALYPNYRLLPKHQTNSALVLVEVIADGADKDKLKIPLETDEVFRFQLKFSSAAFREATHLSAYDLDTYVLFATNDINHTAGADLLLSTPVDTYNSLRDYEPGYMVQSGGGFFTALQSSNNANPHNTGEATYWKSVANGDTYVSQADLRTRASVTTPLDRDAIMLIEINHKATLQPAYKLVDAALKCREVSYKIKLLTR